ncbi:hypothetical protein V8G54_029815, partial [Vigna mungo]
DKVDLKSISGGCHSIERNIVSWLSKKQSTITLSTIEALYIYVAHCCSKLLWIKNQLEYYNYFKVKISIYCYNKVVISLFKNLTLLSREKHIELKHHFICDHVKKDTTNL